LNSVFKESSPIFFSWLWFFGEQGEEDGRVNEEQVISPPSSPGAVNIQETDASLEQAALSETGQEEDTGNESDDQTVLMSNSSGSLDHQEHDFPQEASLPEPRNVLIRPTTSELLHGIPPKLASLLTYSPKEPRFQEILFSSQNRDIMLSYAFEFPELILERVSSYLGEVGNKNSVLLHFEEVLELLINSVKSENFILRVEASSWEKVWSAFEEISRLFVTKQEYEEALKPDPSKLLDFVDALLTNPAHERSWALMIPEIAAKILDTSFAENFVDLLYDEDDLLWSEAAVKRFARLVIELEMNTGMHLAEVVQSRLLLMLSEFPFATALRDNYFTYVAKRRVDLAVFAKGLEVSTLKVDINFPLNAALAEVSSLVAYFFLRCSSVWLCC
jgi:hypothetical protein